MSAASSQSVIDCDRISDGSSSIDVTQSNYTKIPFVIECKDFDEVAIEKGLPEREDPTEYPISYTLVIIMPCLMKKVNEIIRDITRKGFKLLVEKETKLTAEEAVDFYEEHFGEPSFPLLIYNMSNKPFHVVAFAKTRAVHEFQNLLGPKDVARARIEFPNSLRSRYGKVKEPSTGLHGSASDKAARREIKFFFPEIELYWGSISVQDTMQKIKNALRPNIMRGLTTMFRVEPSDPRAWLENWLLQNDPEAPKVISYT